MDIAHARSIFLPSPKNGDAIHFLMRLPCLDGFCLQGHAFRSLAAVILLLASLFSSLVSEFGTGCIYPIGCSILARLIFYYKTINRYKTSPLLGLSLSLKHKHLYLTILSHTYTFACVPAPRPALPPHEVSLRIFIYSPARICSTQASSINIIPDI